MNVIMDVSLCPCAEAVVGYLLIELLSYTGNGNIQLAKCYQVVPRDCPGGLLVKNLPSNTAVQSLVGELRSHILWDN